MWQARVSVVLRSYGKHLRIMKLHIFDASRKKLLTVYTKMAALVNFKLDTRH